MNVRHFAVQLSIKLLSWVYSETYALGKFVVCFEILVFIGLTKQMNAGSKSRVHFVLSSYKNSLQLPIRKLPLQARILLFV